MSHLKVRMVSWGYRWVMFWINLIQKVYRFPAVYDVARRSDSLRDVYSIIPNGNDFLMGMKIVKIAASGPAINFQRFHEETLVNFSVLIREHLHSRGPSFKFLPPLYGFLTLFSA